MRLDIFGANPFAIRPMNVLDEFRVKVTLAMKPKLLCLTLVLSGGLLGCSTAAQHRWDVQSPKVAALAKVKLEVVKVDSEETDGQDGRGENAVDGNPNTCWHTQWHGNSPGLPHEIIIELLPPSVIKGFTYLPRQDTSDHGTIKDYEFYVSDDGRNFGQPVKKGVFEPGKEEKIETFEPIKCRFIKLKAISEIDGLLWTSAAEIGVIQSREDTSVMTYQKNRATSLLAEFERTKSIDRLESALRAVESMPFPGVDKTVQPTVARRELAKMWLKLLTTIDQNIDTSYDSNNPTNWAALNLVPPGPDGWLYPSGVDPNDIKEPEIRAQYEAALKQNNDKILRANFQTGLRNIDLLADLDVGRFFPANYTSSKEDQSELENLMQQTKLSPIRTLKLKALFESTNLAGNDVDTNLTKQISDILAECQKIKPGMTRAELPKVFTTEGGLSTATHQTFVYRGCPYIKVDVEFTPSEPKQKMVEEQPTDIISKVSKPYLDWSISD